MAGEKLDAIGGIAPEGPGDFVVDQDCGEWGIAAADSFAAGEDVGPNAEHLGGEEIPGTPEAGDDFIEDQEDVVFVADLS